MNRARLRPIACPGLVRLGPRADGGYVVPQAAVDRTALLLSLGVKQDWSFERDFVARNPQARVVGVDPSVGPGLFARQAIASLKGLAGAVAPTRRRERRRHAAVLARSIDYFRFFGPRHRHLRLRVAAEGDEETTVTLAQLLARVGDGLAPYSVFLKMDIEEGEYEVMPQVAAHADRLNCVVVECHAIGRRARQFEEAVERLGTRFRIAHVHANNYGGYADAVGLPEVLEVTFVNEALLSGPAEPSPHAYPRPGLDWPNAPSRPDVELDFGDRHP